MVEVEENDGSASSFHAHVTRFVTERELCFVERRFGALTLREYGFRINAASGRVDLVSWCDCRWVMRQRWRSGALAGLKAMTSAIKQVAETGSVEAWLSQRGQPMSAHYRWRPVHQARLFHQVAKAVEIIRERPRAVEQFSLSDWELGVTEQGRSYVAGDGGIRVGYHSKKIPRDTGGHHPIILGTLRGKIFLLDGAHRTAASLLAGKKTIPAVWLSEAETAACVREGFEQKVRFESMSLC